MSELLIAVLGFAVLLVLILARVPIATAMALVGVGGTACIAGWQTALATLKQSPFERASSYTLVVVPLFMLMGYVAARAGLSQKLFRAANVWLGHWRGGLAMAPVGACAGFAAICGSSVATGATMCTVALPEMRRYRYADSLSTGSIAAGGTLGILIPPRRRPLWLLHGAVPDAHAARYLAGAVAGRARGHPVGDDCDLHCARRADGRVGHDPADRADFLPGDHGRRLRSHLVRGDHCRGGPDRPDYAASNEAHKDVQIVATFKGSYAETLTGALTAARAGAAPHIVQVYEVGTRTILDAGLIVPLAEVSKGQLDTARFVQPILDYYTIDGALSCMPFNSSTAMLYYNRDVFKAVGLDPDQPPTTYEEMYAVGKKLHGPLPGATWLARRT